MHLREMRKGGGDGKGIKQRERENIVCSIEVEMCGWTYSGRRFDDGHLVSTW